MQKPYVRIDHVDGPIIKIQEINNYHGFDQNGDYRQLYNVDLDINNKAIFTELMFKSDSTKSITMYYNQSTFVSGGNTSKSYHTSYVINNQPIKTLNYNNVKRDFARLGFASKSLKQANNIRILQYTSAAIATGLLVQLISNNCGPNKTKIGDNRNDIMFISCGLACVFPFTLEKAKERLLVDALRNYK